MPANDFNTNNLSNGNTRDKAIEQLQLIKSLKEEAMGEIKRIINLIKDFE